jgi:hypothetical protein
MPYTSPNTNFNLKMFPPTSKNIIIVGDNPTVRKQEDFNGILVLILFEPDAIFHHRQLVIDNHRNFDYIFTYDQHILNACSNARLYLCGGTWIEKSTYNNMNLSRKQPKISCLTGMKEFTPAHTFRKMLYKSQKSLSFLPITWFRSSKDRVLLPKIGDNPVIGDSKDPLFLDYQYSVAIENCRENNYFTEKLLDCLLTKTIPIYYGCPNISTWFDTRGWIILENTSIQEFRVKCSRLPNYAAHINVINENHERAKNYIDVFVNLQRVMNFGD